MSSTSSPRTSIGDELLPLQHYRNDEKQTVAALPETLARMRNTLQIALHTFSTFSSLLLCVLLVLNLLLLYRSRPSLDHQPHIHRSYGSMDRAYMSVDQASDSLWEQMSVTAGMVRVPAGDAKYHEGGGFIGM